MLPKSLLGFRILRGCQQRHSSLTYVKLTYDSHSRQSFKAVPKHRTGSQTTPAKSTPHRDGYLEPELISTKFACRCSRPTNTTGSRIHWRDCSRASRSVQPASVVGFIIFRSKNREPAAQLHFQLARKNHHTTHHYGGFGALVSQHGNATLGFFLG